jgi:omega-6 fatty acid desaturase (delta-12 desaturase)
MSNTAATLNSRPSLPRVDANEWTADRRSLKEGLTTFSVHFALYFATLAGALAALPIVVNLAFAVANGVFIALLFIIAHDAAHGSLVPGRKLNLWLARLAFVPCVHSLSLWRVIHNQHHHRRTNLRGVDGVWAPMNKKEYDASRPQRRWLERVFRGPFGPVIYYYLAFWPHRVLLPLAPEVRTKWKRHLPNTLFVLSGLALTLLGVMAAGSVLAHGRASWLVLLLGWAIPYAVWNYLMAFTTYLNHTHPSIGWFDRESLWSRHRGNVLGSASVILPFPLALIPLYRKVMAHTVHHVRPVIPVYALVDAQAELKRDVGTVVEYKLTLDEYRRIYRGCKLFDFERMCWTDFDGVPTS